jgi:hypothetical protein
MQLYRFVVDWVFKLACLGGNDINRGKNSQR